MQFLYYLEVLQNYCRVTLSHLPWLKKGGDLNYRLTLPPYMKTHPVFYVGRLKRYLDPNYLLYPQLDLESEAKDSPLTSYPYVDVVDSESEGDHASNADHHLEIRSEQ